MSTLQLVVQEFDEFDMLFAPVDSWLLSDALTVAVEEHIALYDALFIALAEALSAPLVTADRRQAATKRCAVRLLG